MHPTYNILIQKNLLPVIKQSIEEHPDKHPTVEHSLCVLLEEVDELKAEVFKKHSKRNLNKIIKEAMQVAHCAVRLVHDNFDGSLAYEQN